ncbi:MAG TPA: Fe-S cluster assembly protein SufD [Kiritimatiellia bacterium]|nr:Fe-S cluster assembly protein SufD [Kiritimatiellia bacterium]
MTTILEHESGFWAGLNEDAFSGAAGGEEGVLRERRTQAFQAYRSLPLPTLRDEEWRRTDPGLFPFEAVSRLANLGEIPFPAASDLDDRFDVVIAVTDEGYAIRDNRDGKVCGLTVLPLREALRQYGDDLAACFDGPAVLERDRKFTQLNSAFWNVGFYIHVAKNTAVERGVLIRYEITGRNALVIPRLIVHAEAGSRARVTEYYQSPDGQAMMCIGAREMYVDQAAQLSLYAVQEWGNGAYQIAEDWARVGRDGQIDWVTLSLGSKISKMMMGCEVAEPNANAFMSGLFFANEKQHIDQRTLQKHAAPHTYSNLLYKGAVKDEGRSVYQGVIAAGKGAIKVDAYQMNKNLVLNPGARADSLPGLMIDADDLKCSHGSTMGNLSPLELFYLKSRGLSDVEARRMLVLAFFEEIIAKLDDEFLQERVRADVNRKIG